ncbi:aryl-sulfate sulfotransferase [bacterium]|nr:aryl-sulfate sulfotransferase [bacterium]
MASNYMPNEDGVLVLNGVSVPSDFPEIEITQHIEPDSGRFFLAVPGEKYYTLILDRSGAPVYYQILQNDPWFLKPHSANLITMYRDFGTWAGFIGMDASYTVVDTFMVPDGYNLNVHELLVLPDGRYLLIADHRKAVDMSMLVPGGRPDAEIICNDLFLMDAEDRPLFRWCASDHYGILDAENYNYKLKNIDFIHMNAIAVDLDGHYLVSCRNMSEITKIHRETGEIIWRLGGSMDQFQWIGCPERFSYQHDVRVLPNGNITIYDNGNYHEPHFSRVLEIKIDDRAGTAEKVWEYRASPDVQSFSMGNAQRLSNGNTLIDWASEVYPRITEVCPDGSIAFEMAFGEPVMCYRAFKTPWKGKAGAPTLVLESGTDRVTALFNKFGDTGVTGYRIYAGHTSQTFSLLGETGQPYFIMDEQMLKNGYTYFIRVTAVNQAGEESAFSNVERVRAGFAAAGMNLLRNGSFSSADSDWRFVTGNDSILTCVMYTDKQFHCIIGSGGELAEDVILYQDDISLLKGKTYQFEFDAWSGDARPIEADIEADYYPWTSYSRIGMIQLKPKEQHFSYIFRMDAASEFNARVIFRMGGVTSDVHLDNVSLVRMATDRVPQVPENGRPAQCRLEPAYPNPFNPETAIAFFLEDDSDIDLKITDICGRTVDTLKKGRMSAGRHVVKFNARGMASGVYFCRLTVHASGQDNSVRRVRKMVLLK